MKFKQNYFFLLVTLLTSEQIFPVYATSHADFDLLKSLTYEEISVEAFDIENNNIISTLVPRSQNSELRKEKLSNLYAADKESNREQVQMQHMMNLTLTVKVKNETYILDLYINRYLIASGYTEQIITDEGSTTNDVNQLATHCYYLGTVRGYENSSAAVSTCYGITGTFIADGKSYFIEPVPGEESCLTLDCPHRVRDATERIELPEGLGCGGAVIRSSASREKRAPIVEWPQGTDRTRLVEVFLVNDYYQFQKYGSSVTTVTARAKMLFNIASLHYQSQDIYLVLVGQEVWTSFNRIPLNISNSIQLLWDFCNYVQMQVTTSHDTAVYLTPQGPFDVTPTYGGVIGRAYLNGMCSSSTGCAYISEYVTALETGITIAHEIGHNFGLQHPDNQPGCPCDQPSGKCIMGPPVFEPEEWSSCSKRDLTSQTSYSRFTCLYNMPQTIFDQNAPSQCGNGLIESGEQCDCGASPSSECNQSCCDKTTCRLIGSAQCAHGLCCNVNTCTYKSKYTSCRSLANSCDLSEYCTGSNHLCPSNVYMKDYNPCTINSVSGSCISGQCVNKDTQCKVLYGSASASGPDDCYTFNRYGDFGTNCGFTTPGDFNDYVSCTQANMFCGNAQCTGGTLQLPDGYGGYSQFGDGSGLRCWHVQFMVDISAGNPGYVPNGTPCGNRMVCVNQACVSLDSPSIPSVSCGTCSGHGVCNSMGQCHCDAGFAPPDCSQPGEGGSLHSNGFSPIQAPASSSSTSSPATTTRTSTTTTTRTSITTTTTTTTTTRSSTTTTTTTTTRSSTSTIATTRLSSTTTMIIIPTTVITTTSSSTTRSTTTSSSSSSSRSSSPTTRTSSSTTLSSILRTTVLRMTPSQQMGQQPTSSTTQTPNTSRQTPTMPTGPVQFRTTPHPRFTPPPRTTTVRPSE